MDFVVGGDFNSRHDGNQRAWRHLNGAAARDKYATQLQERLDLLGVAAMLKEAEKTRDLVAVARKAVDKVHNRPPDKGEWVVEKGCNYVVHSVTGNREWWTGEQQDDAAQCHTRAAARQVPTGVQQIHSQYGAGEADGQG